MKRKLGGDIKFLIGLGVSLILAGGVAFLFFGVIAPFICSKLPSTIGEWRGLAEIGVYI